MNEMSTQDQIYAAEDALEAIDAHTSDEAIAGIVADYYLIARPWGIQFAILHDVRPSTPARLATQRRLSRRPDFMPSTPFGPCPVPYTWHRKNMVGIRLRGPSRMTHNAARQWIIDAMLAGYAVFYSMGAQYSSAGQGTIAEIRSGCMREGTLK